MTKLTGLLNRFVLIVKLWIQWHLLRWNMVKLLNWMSSWHGPLPTNHWLKLVNKPVLRSVHLRRSLVRLWTLFAVSSLVPILTNCHGIFSMLYVSTLHWSLLAGNLLRLRKHRIWFCVIPIVTVMMLGWTRFKVPICRSWLPCLLVSRTKQRELTLQFTQPIWHWLWKLHSQWANRKKVRFRL